MKRTLVFLFVCVCLSVPRTSIPAPVGDSQRLKRLEAGMEYLLGTGWDKAADDGPDGIRKRLDRLLQELQQKKKG